MDGLATLLVMYKEKVADVAMLVGVVKSLTGLTISYHIIIEKNASKQSAVGPVSSLSLAVLGIRYATLADDRSLVLMHSLQVVVDTVNLTVYFCHTANKWQDVVEPLLKGCCLVLAGLGYAELEDPEKVCMRFGTGLGALSVVTLASPFTNLRRMIKECDTITINLIITLLSMIASLLWVLVGLTVSNPAMLVQHVCGLLLNTVHVTIYFLYHK